MKRGFIVAAWTGPFLNRLGRPILFGSERTARKFLARAPFGGIGCKVYPCTTRRGTNGKPDFIVGKALP